MTQQVDRLRPLDPDLVETPLLSRKQLLEIEEDPSKLETVARLMGAVNLDNLFRFMQGPPVPAAARLEFQKMLNRMGRLEPDTSSGDSNSGPQVVINITRARDAEDAVTIEGKATPAE